MKIVVVCYDEYKCNKNRNAVLNDIIAYWDSADERTRLEMGKCLRNQLDELSKGGECDIEFEDTSDIVRPYIVENLKKKHIDLLVTYNLAGFELCTLTDGLAYNLVNCRQFHFVEDEECPNSKYVDKLQSINMFIINNTDRKALFNE